jgi:putative FmdB family regulatory protein
LPTYEYACTKCGHRLEAVQSFSDDPLTKCSECGGALRKVYGNVGIVFKGSGFYKTDSRNGSGSKAKGPASESSGTEAATKSEATPASSDAPAASKTDTTSPKKESPGSSSSGSTDGGKKDAQPAASKSS